MSSPIDCINTKYFFLPICEMKELVKYLGKTFFYPNEYKS